MKTPTTEGFSPYGQTSQYESKVLRGEPNKGPGIAGGVGSIRTPLHLINGTVTPSGLPLSKIMDDALIALYQNGERLRPENGYPMRLLLPGYQGNTNVKYLRRIKLTEGPSQTRDETSRYSITKTDGKTIQFYLQYD